MKFEFEIKTGTRDFKGDSLMESIDNYTIVDIETTGLDPKLDEIIELAAIKIRNNEIIDNYSKLIKPKEEIDCFITNLTGITNDMLKNAPVIEDVIEEFLNFINDDIVIGHNVNFDINFIYDNCIKILEKPFTNNFIDTLRISRKYIDTNNHKLQTLAEKFEIDYSGAHRALKDCYITQQLYEKLKNEMKNDNIDYKILLEKFTVPENNMFKDKNITIKGTIKNYGYEFLVNIAKKCGAKRANNIFLSNTDYLILGYKSYNIFCNETNCGSNIEKARNLEKEEKLKVISEYEFYKLNNIPIKENLTQSKRKAVAKDIFCTTEKIDTSNPFYQKECVFTGTLEKMSRKEAMQLIANLGGKNRDTVTQQTNFLILGNNDYCKSLIDGKSSKQKKAEKYKLQGQDVEIISENVFYDMIDELNL